MAKYDYDLFVIGGGSGGVRAARISGGYGAKVAVAEEYRYGGTCVIRGCIPKKLLVYASHFREDFEDAAAYGWTVEGARFDWGCLIANKDKEIDRLNAIYERLLGNAGAETFHDRAVLEDAHTVRVGSKKVTARKVLIATGGTPALPELPGIEHAITSNEAFHLDALPKRVAIVGGGYIAAEFAGIFNGLGAEVTEIYRREQILRGFDDDLRDGLAEEMRTKGVNVVTRLNVAKIERKGAELRLTLTDGGALATDCVMFATGRRPNTQGLGLESAGVQTDNEGAVVVDDFSRSSTPNIFAVGDVTNRINLTPVAIMEGHAFADTEFGGQARKPDHRDVASAVFSQPPIGTVGLTETEARAKYGAVDIYKSRFRPLKHTLTGRDEFTMMKLIVERENDTVVGAHMLGADAPEIIQMVAVAMRCGVTKSQFDHTVGIHPTAAEEFVTMREKWRPPKAKAAE